MTALLSAIVALFPVFVSAQDKVSARQERFLRDVETWAKSLNLNATYEDGAVKLLSDAELYAVSFFSDSNDNEPYWIRLTRIAKLNDKITKKDFEEEYMESILMNTPFKANYDDEVYVLYMDMAYDSSESFLKVLPSYISYMENIILQLSGDSPLELAVQRLVSDMVRVDGGSFMMGGADDSVANGVSNLPAHKVVLSSYCISKYEVTQALWEAVMNDNPSQIKGKERPVENVSWTEVSEFINRLNQLSGYSFRLPTEAEWEYASRGGSRSKGYSYPGSNDCSSVSWFQDNSLEETHEVGKLASNELGLYDMGGNVSEWCSDWLGDYSANTENNPKGPSSGTQKVYRGGNWLSSKDACTPFYRRGASVDSKSGSRGFRLAMDVPSSTRNITNHKDQANVKTEAANKTESVNKEETDNKADVVTLYDNVQVKPTFKGGTVEKFAQWVEGMVGNLEYSGSVTLGFTVSVYGKVSDVVIIKGGSKKINERIKNVVRSSPNWTPGKEEGKVVPVKCRVTLNFSK